MSRTGIKVLQGHLARALGILSAVGLALAFSGYALAEQSVMIERNLFSPNRQAPSETQGPEGPQVDPSSANLQLDAVIINKGQKVALVSYLDAAQEKGRQNNLRRKWVRPNDRLETGHVVTSVEATQISLLRGNETLVLLLHGEKALKPPVQKLPAAKAIPAKGASASKAK
jgi:hypothetical protein